MAIAAERPDCVGAVGVRSARRVQTFVDVFVTVASREAWWTRSATRGRIARGRWTLAVAQTRALRAPSVRLTRCMIDAITSCQANQCV